MQTTQQQEASGNVVLRNTVWERVLGLVYDEAGQGNRLLGLVWQEAMQTTQKQEASGNSGVEKHRLGWWNYHLPKYCSNRSRNLCRQSCSWLTSDMEPEISPLIL